MDGVAVADVEDPERLWIVRRQQLVVGGFRSHVA
jgi:hypothetical protein